ncbi:MAG: rhomboid family intramembrane serine protease [Acidimicrobiales bacterium]
MAITIAVLWVVEGVDQLLLNDRLQRNGIQPRQLDGLDGIVWAPFLHASWGHLASNTVPFAAPGASLAPRCPATRGCHCRCCRRWRRRLTWLFGSSGNHVGASGVVFGFFGALLGAAIFERRPLAIAPALVAIMMYSGIVVGFAPQAGVSWKATCSASLAAFLSLGGSPTEHRACVAGRRLGR